MLFQIKDRKAKLVSSKDFSLEKDLQTLVEENTKEIFNLDFIDTEFKLDEFRFDSVAYDEENKAFVIIEYKKGSNESLVDQGYAYLSKVLTHKSDLVLLYNRVKHSDKQVKDFDWEATRVYFVSPKFTIYQKAATSVMAMPFRLFEVVYYNNECLMVNEINSGKSQFDLSGESKESSGATREIKVYEESDHMAKLSEAMVELYEKIKERIMEFPEITIVPRKNYIAFKKNNTNIVDIEPYSKRLDVYLNVKKGKLSDPYNKTEDMSSKGHHANGDYCFGISKEEDIDYLVTLIKQSYKINS